MRRAAGWVLGLPTTLGLLALMVILAIITGPITGPVEPLRSWLGTGLVAFDASRNPLSTLTSALVSDGLGELLAALLATLAVIGASERLMGWWRTALAWGVTAMVGGAAGMTLQSLGVFSTEMWAHDPNAMIVLDPFTPIAGAALAASAFANRLWRRRMRVVGFAGLLALLLYSGTSADLYRLFAGIAGLLLGLLLAPRERVALRWERSSHHEARTLLAALLLLGALAPFITLFSHVTFGPVHSLWMLTSPTSDSPGEVCGTFATPECLNALAQLRTVGPGPIITAIAPSLFLALAAFGLLRGRRIAAWLAIAVNLLLAYLSAFYDGVLPWAPDNSQLLRADGVGTEILPLGLSVLLPLTLALLIGLNLTHFPVQPARVILRRYVITLIAAFGLTSMAYVVAGTALRDEFEPPATLINLILDLPERFFPVGFLDDRLIEFIPTGALGGLVYYGIGAVFWLAALAASAAVIHSAAGRHFADDLSRVRSMLRQGGQGTLSHMATWQGNTYWFSPDEAVAVAYRVVSGVALTMNGPIGPVRLHDQAIRGFARFCDDNGWTPVFYGVGAESTAAFERAGWHVTVVGDDTVLDPAAFTMSGKKWQDVRSSINRASKLGIVSSWTSWEQLSLPARTQIEVISEEWVAGRNLPEMGFTLGGVDELLDPDVRLMLAVDATGRIEAVTSWLPTYREGAVIGWTLDLMRRRPDSMNGVVEFLIAETVCQAKERELQFVSLSTAPLARAGSADGDADRTAQILGYVGRRLESLYGFQSLMAFKVKFQPELRPILLAYQDVSVLPAVGLALVRAYLPSMTMAQVVSLMRSLIRPAVEPKRADVDAPPIVLPEPAAQDV